jgi:Flp pilus assembly protein TadD
MRTRLLFLAVLASLAFSTPFPLMAQRGAAPDRHHTMGTVIEVQVRNPDGTPAPDGIHVALEAAEGGAVDDSRTSEGGKCHFTPTELGVYIVRLKQPGYKEVFVRIELTRAGRGFADLELKPIAGQAPPPDTPKTAGDDPVFVGELSIPDKARQEFEKGQSALKDDKLDSGISHLRKALKLYEPFPQAYLLLGTAYLEQKNWKGAELALQKAISLNSKSAEAYLALGAVFNQTKDYPKAETALLRGLGLKPDAPGGHYELAKTYWALGRWQEAAPHARKAVSDIPDLASPHVLLGNVLLKENNPQGALHEYQEYLRLDPNGSMAPGTRQMIEKIQKVLHP